MIIRLLKRTSYPGLRILIEWMDCFDLLQQLRPKLLCKVVKWDKPDEERVKCNTEGSSNGNLGISSYGFCVRDYNGDLVYAESANIGVITCMVAEATTIWKALNFCK